MLQHAVICHCLLHDFGRFMKNGVVRSGHPMTWVVLWDCLFGDSVSVAKFPMDPGLLWTSSSLRRLQTRPSSLPSWCLMFVACDERMTDKLKRHWISFLFFLLWLQSSYWSTCPSLWYGSRGVYGRNLLSKTLMSLWPLCFRSKSLSLHSKRFPSETMHAFKALFACNRPGHFMGPETLEVEDWPKQILDDFGYVQMAHALWYQRPGTIRLRPGF